MPKMTTWVFDEVKAQGLTQRQVAQACGIYESRLSYLKYGDFPWYEHEKFAVADLLGKDVDELSFESLLSMGKL